MIKTENLTCLYYFKEKLPASDSFLHGLIATAPTEFITGLFHPVQWLWIGAVTLVFTVGSNLFFYFGLSHYSSAGG